MQDTTLIFDDMSAFRGTANREIFNEIFGRRGGHCWEKFNELDHDIIRFYDSLDFENRRKLADYFAPHQAY